MPSLLKLSAIVAGLVIIATAVMADAPETAKKKRHKHKTEAAASKTIQRGADKFPAGPLYYNGGEYLGDDPDPNIRFQLWRDLGARFGGPE